MSTGARCVGTLLHEMKRRGKDCRFGVVSMCIGTLSLSLPDVLGTHAWLTINNVGNIKTAGTGMGAAAVFERGDCVDELRNARTAENNNLLSKDAQ